MLKQNWTDRVTNAYGDLIAVDETWLDVNNVSLTMTLYPITAALAVEIFPLQPYIIPKTLSNERKNLHIRVAGT